MARKTTATTKPSQSVARETHDQFAALNGAAAETLARSCEACTRGAVTMGAEVLSFFNTRLTRDVELSQAVSQCENWAGVADLQQEWARQATQDYFSQASKLVQLAGKLTQESWEPIYEQSNEMFTELNKPVS